MKLRDPTPCAPLPGGVGSGERRTTPLTDTPSPTSSDVEEHLNQFMAKHRYDFELMASTGFTPRPTSEELLNEALQFMDEYSDDLKALAATPVPPPAPEPIDYAHAFKVWWHQAVNPAVPPSRTAAETHVLFAQHMVLVELERAGR